MLLSHVGLPAWEVAMEFLGYLVLIAGSAALAVIFAIPAMQLLAQKLWNPR
jgi:hypothetical protein